MELRQLRYFVAVADELHFTRAAERLHVAQPPLSRQIRQLEEELKIQLFRRTRRKVELTQAGELLLLEARKILKQAEIATLVVQRAVRGEVGLLQIGTTSSLPFMGLLPKLLGAYRKQYPHVQMVLRELNTKQQLDALHAERLDVGFVRLPTRMLPPRIAVHTLYSEPLLVVLPEMHPLAASKSINLRRLADEPFITYPPELGGGLHDVVAHLFEEAGLAPRIEQEALTVPMAVSLVAARLGVALVPRSIRSVQMPGVTYRPLTTTSAKTEIALAYRTSDRSPRLMAFVRLCRTMRIS